MTPFAHGLLAHIAVRRDDLDAAARHLADGEALIGELGPHFGLEVLLWSRALLLEASGERDAGLNVLARRGPRPGASTP